MREKGLTPQRKSRRDEGERKRLLGLVRMMVAASVLILFCSVTITSAKEIFPAGDITFICYSQPGGAFDIMDRGLSPFLSKYLKEVSPGCKGGDVKVKNMTGGSGEKAAYYLFNDAKPDGYTIGDFNRGNLYKFILSEEKLPFDIMKFSWVFSVYNVRRVFISNKKSSITSWEDMLAASKKAPLKWALGSVGGSETIESIYVKETLGINVKFTNWGSQAAMIGAIIRGDANVALINIQAIKPLVDAKEVNFLFSFSEKRLDPQVPTIAEKGFPQVLKYVGGRVGNTTLGPPNLDPEAKRIIIAAAKKVFADPEFQVFCKKVGVELNPLYDKELEEGIRENLKFYKDLLPTLQKYKDLLE